MVAKNVFKTIFTVLTLAIFLTGVSVVSTSQVMADETKVVKEDKAKETADKVKADKPATTEKAVEKIKGSDKKGKFYYKKECKSCHGKKGDGGEVTPVSKTIKQWERFFKKNKHGEKKLSDEYDAEHLIHIKTFLINHAADSDQPETCG